MIELERRIEALKEFFRRRKTGRKSALGEVCKTYRINERTLLRWAHKVKRLPIDEWAAALSSKGPEKKSCANLSLPSLAQARARLTAIRQFQSFCVSMPKGAALERAAAESGFQAATMKRWLTTIRYLPEDQWIAALAPLPRGHRPATDIDPEIWNLFLSDYMRPGQRTAAGCYYEVERIAAARGIEIPCLRTFQRRLAAVDRAEIVLTREGERALSKLYPHQTRRRDNLAAYEIVNSDGWRCDCFVDFGDGEPRRPFLICWQDVYSGMILSWRVSQVENTEAIRLSFGDMIDRFGRIPTAQDGTPGHVVLDNGRAYSSKQMSGGMRRFRAPNFKEEAPGLFAHLGLRVHFAMPAHGQAKPIERAFKDLVDAIARHAAVDGAFTGTVLKKPENYGTRAVPIADFLRLCEQQIAAHNTRQGRTGGVCNGRSFAEVFNESIESRQLIGVSREERLWWLCQATTPRASDPSGTITWQGERYWAPELVQHPGEKFILRYDPDFPQKDVHVYSLNGSVLCTARWQQPAGFVDPMAAAELASGRRGFVKRVKGRVKERNRLAPAEIARQQLGNTVLEQPAPVSSVVRMRPRKQQQSQQSAEVNVINLGYTEEEEMDIYRRLQEGLDRIAVG